MNDIGSLGESQIDGYRVLREKRSPKVYSPDSPLRNPAKLVGDVFRDIWRYRELTWVLFQRDLKAQFRQSILGYAWLILPTLANTLVWQLLNRQRLINVDPGEIPYPVFVLIGSTLWTAFGAMLIAPLNAVSANAQVFKKLNVPIESFILASAIRAAFNLMIALLVVVPIALFQGLALRPAILAFPFAAIALLTLAFSMGMLIVPIGTLYSDIKTAIAPVLAVLMFTAPVVFPVPNDPGLISTIMRLNPITPVLSLSRDLLTTGQWTWLPSSMAWTLASSLLALVSFAGLRVAKPHIILRMGM